jgi:hypothetical protein
MKEHEPSAQQVMEILQACYDELDGKGAVEIGVDLVADAAYRVMDPQHRAPILVIYTSVLELRQLARSVCRRKVGLEEPDDPEQSRLFDDQLQGRYPTKRNGREVYVKREYLSEDEYIVNSARLRAGSAALARHADALDAERLALKAAGYFDALGARA